MKPHSSHYQRLSKFLRDTAAWMEEQDEYLKGDHDTRILWAQLEGRIEGIANVLSIRADGLASVEDDVAILGASE